MCNNGDFENLREGDYKTIELTTGEIVQPQIAGLDTYRGMAYLGQMNSIGHHIDFISKDCCALSLTADNYGEYWTTASTTNGTAEESNPYLASSLYSWIMDTVYPVVPSDVKTVITNKENLIETRYSSSSTLTESTSRKGADIGPIWLPCEFEISGSHSAGSSKYFNGMDVQYPLFIGSGKHRIKKSTYQGTTKDWWLMDAATMRVGQTDYCVWVHYYGHVTWRQAYTSRAAIPLCFRIAETL